MKPPVGRSPLATLFFLACLLGGFYFAVQGVVGAFANIHARREWVQVEATIVQSRLEDEGDHELSRPIPTVRYEYDYKGRDFQSSSINPPDNLVSHGTPFLSLGQIWIAQHPKGMRTTALVDPDAPQRSALKTNLNYRNTTWLFLPVPFLMIGIAGLVGQRPFPWRKIIFLWGLLAIGLHFAAGPVSLYAWTCIALTAFVMMRLAWSNSAKDRSNPTGQPS